MLEESIISITPPAAHLWGAATGYSIEDITSIATLFDVPWPISVDHFPGKGNINLHTFEVIAGGEPFLLQKVNSDVFSMPHRVMSGMIASIEAQRESIDAGKGDSLWEPIRLVPTRDGKPYLDLSDETGLSVWRMMVRIKDCVSYKSLSEVATREAQLALAEEIGRGVAIYSDLTASIEPNGVDGSLPGYRDTALYYRQFHSVMARNRGCDDAKDYLPRDPIVRASTELHFLLALSDEEFEARTSDPDLVPFIELVRAREPFAMRLWSGLEGGQIRHTLIHGDTKIENFLFDSQSARVKALVDLDTIMPFTWLADWGDLQRSMVNVAGEKERDLSKVLVDEEVYEAVLKGFLQSATEITSGEVELMVAAVQAITLELGVRFLTDYLRGDTYFQLAEGDPADLNKVRAMVQLSLYQRLEEFAPRAEDLVRKYRS